MRRIDDEDDGHARTRWAERQQSRDRAARMAALAVRSAVRAGTDLRGGPLDDRLPGQRVDASPPGPVWPLLPVQRVTDED